MRRNWRKDHVSLVKIPSCLIFLAFSRGGSNPVSTGVEFSWTTSLDSYGHLLGVFSIFQFPVRFQTIASDGDHGPPSTTSRPQSRSRAAETSSARSPLFGLPLKTLGSL